MELPEMTAEQQHDKDRFARPGDEIQPSSYTKLPVTIRAIRWSGTNLRAVIDFIGRHPSADDWTWEHFEEVVRTKGLKIFTLEGHHMASVGDYIIKGVHGEVYPCKPDIFWKTYERATAPLPETGSIEDVREKLRKSIEREQELERLLAEARGERNYFMGLVPPAPVSASGRIEIRNNEDGTLDEAVLEHGPANFHLEQLDTGVWWMALTLGKRRVDINLHAKGKITANVSDEGDEPTEARSTTGLSTEDAARLEAMTKATYSHVDGRDLLHQLQPNGAHHIDIVVRINGEDRRYDGDWLKTLTHARDGHNMGEYADNPKLRAHIEAARAAAGDSNAGEASGALSATQERKA